VEEKKAEGFNEEQQEVLKSIRTSRIVFPILIGLGVVGYWLYNAFDKEEFAKIEWTEHTLYWCLLSVVLLIIRHIAYAYRLRVLSEKAFSWKKCIELIFIWEFSSAVSPTSVGGSAVAMVVLSQEKLPAAKTTTLVLHSAILDTIFFVGILPILFIFFGTNIIRPDMDSLSDIDGWGYTFISPRTIKRIIVGCTRLSLLKKYRHKAVELGDDIIVASAELKKKAWSFHLSAFGATAVAWSCRFLLLNCLIIAFMHTSTDFDTQANLYARLQTMFVIMAFSPTPGGAGFAEVLFGGFLTDYVDTKTLAFVIAMLWRILTYYLYLFIGAILIPNWIRNIINERKKKRLAKNKNSTQE